MLRNELKVQLFLKDFSESGADALRTGLVQHFGARPAARHVALSQTTLQVAQLVMLGKRQEAAQKEQK